MNSVDWEEQWALHAPGFKDGLAHISLEQEKKTLLLTPGAGFGDLSHPTTRLLMQLLPTYVKGKNVIDIGCGSGILSLAALLCGAKHVFAIDIDEEALLHTEKNARLNELQQGLSLGKNLQEFSLNQREHHVVMMNMILSEQIPAWETQKFSSSLSLTILSSGILKVQKKIYRDRTDQWLWTQAKEHHEGEWIAGVYTRSSFGDNS